METNKEKNNLSGMKVTAESGLRMFKFLPGDQLNLNVKFPHYTIVKVECFEYDINNQFELVPHHA